MNYLVVKDKSIKNILYMEYDLDGYVFKPKNSNPNYIKVKEAKIYDKKMIDELLNKKFRFKFNRLSEIILKFISLDDDDTDEGDLMIVLDEIERLKSILDIKYKKFMKIEEYKEYVDKLYFLDYQIQNKLAAVNLLSMYNSNNYTSRRSR